MPPIIPDSFLNIDQLEQYTHLGLTRSYVKGEILLSPGIPCDKLTYVISGRLQVALEDDDGQEKFLFTLSEHSIGMTLFYSEGHETKIIALENSTVCYFSEEQLMQIFRQDEKLIFTIMKNIWIKTRYFTAQSREMSFYRPAARVLRLIYNFCITEGRFVNDYYEVQCKMTQNHIAQITGTHYVTVSKLFRLLKSEGILTKKKDRLIIYDLERLKELINEDIRY